MKRFLRSIFFLLAISFVIPGAVFAADKCCRCDSGDGKTKNLCLTETEDSTCSSIIAESKNDKLAGYACAEEVDCLEIGKDPTGKCSAIGDAASIDPQPTGIYAKTKEGEDLYFQEAAPLKSNIEIPGLVYSEGVSLVDDPQGPAYEIPYLAQFVAAIYRYLLGVSVVVAAIMMVYGGFKYILANTAASIGDGKKLIVDAVIGLILVFGAYLLLFTINPATILLRPLKILTVKKVLPAHMNHPAPSNEGYDAATMGGARDYGLVPSSTCLLTEYGLTDEEITKQLKPVTFLGKKLQFHEKAADAFQNAFIDLEAAPPSSKAGTWVEKFKHDPYSWKTVSCGKQVAIYAGTHVPRLDLFLKDKGPDGVGSDLHALGIAIDLDPCPPNGMCTDEEPCALVSNIPIDVVDIFAKYKIHWLGFGSSWKGLDPTRVQFRDPMHFEYHGLCYPLPK